MGEVDVERLQRQLAAIGIDGGKDLGEATFP